MDTHELRNKLQVIMALSKDSKNYEKIETIILEMFPKKEEPEAFKEGREHFIWSYNYSNKKECLSIATIHACDECGKPATVNSVWVINKASDKAIKQANLLKSRYGLMSELGADEEGNCFCEICYSKCATQEA